jgi:type I restriction enzyme M protein
MKTQDVPVALRDFNKIFSKLEHRHDYVTIFDDFLTAALNFFTPPGYEPHDINCFRRYTEEERKTFGLLILETIKVFDSQIVNQTDWYDPFGDYYQTLSSRGKKSALGQFFTPSTLVNFMAILQGNREELTGKGYRINDPSCGSGRLLIAYHAYFPGNYMYGEDLDLMCCKMTCINMMIHGCEGQVVHRNTLDPTDFRAAWQINHMLRSTGLPSIVPIEKEKSLSWQMGQNLLKEHESQNADQEKKEYEHVLKTVGVQMGMFS